MNAFSSLFKDYRLNLKDEKYTAGNRKCCGNPLRIVFYHKIQLLYEFFINLILSLQYITKHALSFVFPLVSQENKTDHFSHERTLSV